MTLNRLTVVLSVVAVLLTLLSQGQTVTGTELTKVFKLPRMDGLLGTIKQASRQSASFVSDLVVSIPFTKILLTGGALLSLLFIFLRLLIVLGPILILGALTRESTDATDILKMLVEFYNQVIVALDDQAQAQSGGVNQPLST